MKKIYTLTSIALIPSFSFAAANVDTILSKFGSWLNTIAGIIIGLTVIAIFIGIFQMIFSFDKKKDEGKQIMIWGVIALFVMVSIWGIVHFLQGSVGINSDGIKKEDINKLLPKV